MLSNKNRLLIVANYFIGYFFIVPYLIIGLSKLFNLESSTLMEFVFTTLHLLLTLYLAYRLLKSDRLKPFKWKKIFIYVVAVYLFTQVINIICNLIIIFVSGDLIVGDNEVAVNDLISNSPLLAIYLACFFAPITEELVFRASLFKLFKNKYLAYFFGGVCFGLIHFIEILFQSFNLLNILHVLPYIVAGILFSKIYQDTDNIYYTILTHILFNSISLCLTFMLT